MKFTMEEKRHRLLIEISDYVTEIALDHGFDSDAADQLGVNVSNFIGEHFGGQNFTFPRDYHFKLAGRDLDIYNEFTGNNWPELSSKHGMTERGLRKLVHRVKKRVMKRLQPGLDLFDDEG